MYTLCSTPVTLFLSSSSGHQLLDLCCIFTSLAVVIAKFTKTKNLPASTVHFVYYNANSLSCLSVPQPTGIRSEKPIENWWFWTIQIEVSGLIKFPNPSALYPFLIAINWTMVIGVSVCHRWISLPSSENKWSKGFDGWPDKEMKKLVDDQRDSMLILSIMLHWLFWLFPNKITLYKLFAGVFLVIIF